MPRRIALLGSTLTLVLALPAGAGAVATAGAQAGGPSAAATRTCPAPRYPGQGYFTSLTVKRVSCARGRTVTLAHYRCRTRSGRAGRCRSRVLGYRCSEQRQSIPTEINARVTCRSGARRVVYTYQQNT